MEMYKFWLRFHLSLSRGPINNIPALVQIMAWCRPSGKPLYEPMMVYLLTHICVTRPQWVNILRLKLHVSFKCVLLKTCILHEDGGLASNRRQVIIWTDNNQVQWPIYASWWVRPGVLMPISERTPWKISTAMCRWMCKCAVHVQAPYCGLLYIEHGRLPYRYNRFHDAIMGSSMIFITV